MSLDVSLCVTMCSKCEDTQKVFEYNITHNLTEMAKAAGLYEALWRPEEIGAKKAGELTSTIESGLRHMVDNRLSLELLEPSNGWGTYENLLTFVEEYFVACVKYPDAVISVCR